MTRVRQALVVSLLGVWAVLSAQQAHVWTTHLTLWTHALALTPTYPRVLINYGRALDLAGDFTGAEVAYRQAMAHAVTLPPEAQDSIVTIATNNLGHLALAQHDPMRAVRIFDALTTASPTFQPGHVNRAIALTSAGYCLEADAEWDRLHWPTADRPPC